MVNLTTIEQFIKDHKDLAGLGGAALAGAILTKLIPYAWSLLGRFVAFCGVLLSGAKSAADFEKKYLSSLIEAHKALRLPGVATVDTRSPPTLEQVFISLTLDQPRNALSVDGLWDLFAKAELSGALFREVQVKREAGASARQLLGMIADTAEFSKLRTDLAAGALSSSRREAVSSLVSLYDVHFQTKRGQAYIQTILDTEARIAILGKPGSGKSTLLQYLALTYARERVKDPKVRSRGIVRKRLGSGRWLLPIFVQLSRISKILARSDAKGARPTLLNAICEALPPDLRQHGAAESY